MKFKIEYANIQPFKIELLEIEVSAMEPNVTAFNIIQNANRFMSAYHAALQPLCDTSGLPQAAMDILLFLANNPGHDTARDICQYRGFKPGIVSLYVERLAQDGLIERQPVAGDRRKTRLVCTSKAEPLIAQGCVQQQKFALRLREGLTEADLEHFAQCMAILSHNIDAIKKEGI